MNGLDALGVFARRLGYAAGTYHPTAILYRWVPIYRTPMQLYPERQVYMGHAPECTCGMCPDVGPCGVPADQARYVDPTLNINTVLRDWGRR